MIKHIAEKISPATSQSLVHKAVGGKLQRGKGRAAKNCVLDACRARRQLKRIFDSRKSIRKRIEKRRHKSNERKNHVPQGKRQSRARFCFLFQNLPHKPHRKQHSLAQKHRANHQHKKQYLHNFLTSCLPCCSVPSAFPRKKRIFQDSASATARGLLLSTDFLKVPGFLLHSF